MGRQGRLRRVRSRQGDIRKTPEPSVTFGSWRQCRERTARRRTMSRWWIKSFTIVAQVIVPLLLATPSLAQDIVIGIAGPMTGGEAALGRQMRNGAELAVADVNAAGGVLGRRVTLEV